MKLAIKVFLLLVLSAAFIVSAYGQEVVTAVVTACKDGKPLAFANIVFVKNLSGATSDEKGEFRLTFQSLNDSISISYVGFTTKKIPVSLVAEKRSVCLDESAVLLGEVVVSTKQLNHARLFEKFRLVRGSIYAQESETSVGEFNLFLKEMEGSPSFTKYNYDLTTYAEAVKDFYLRYHANTPESRHGRRRNSEEGNYSHYPVINITHEAALAYCDWLTDEYNHQKKRKFQKVKFRLPTINEWQMAALGYSKFQTWTLDENKVEVTDFGDSTTMIGGPGKHIVINAADIDYPWHGAYYFRNKPQNSRHCFMGNFKAPPVFTPCIIPKVAGDGFTMMAHVASYFPNDLGLYDVVGNVAEMIDEKGKACGGSWDHLPKDCTIRSRVTYNQPSSWVGFRVFMEVLEK
ncbi:MAG TPA: SUMF1/EgtB/PvdO family nonheme iron enzyme [Cyclobacteriaceae bacterium]|nr:SUMF1/EgtB/PvdO family nonheme iron enzyme [Cyclobacteriaceae bacterium]